MRPELTTLKWRICILLESGKKSCARAQLFFRGVNMGIVIHYSLFVIRCSLFIVRDSPFAIGH